MRKLRLIIVVPEAPVPFGNAAARWYHVLVKGLSDRGHDVTVFAAGSKPEELAAAREMFPSPSYDVRCYPFPARKGLESKVETLRRPGAYIFGRELRHDLERELTRGVDILHLETLWSGWLGLNCVDRTLVNVLNLYSIDLSTRRPRSARDWLHRQNMFRAERRLLRAYPTLTTISRRLTAAAKEHNPHATVHTIPLSLDHALYAFREKERQSGAPVVSLIGSFTWEPTFSAAIRLLTRLWPEIRRRVPEARLQVVGWGARRALAEFLNVNGVVIEENVPDTAPYFESSDVLLYAPSSASGMKVKILEAFAYGVAVVTNADGVEGIPARDGVHAGITEDDEGLIARTVVLLTSPYERERQRRAARALLEAECSPGVVLKRMEDVYASMVRPRGTPKRVVCDSATAD